MQENFNKIAQQAQQDLQDKGFVGKSGSENFGQSIMLIIGEAGELVDADSHRRFANLVAYQKECEGFLIIENAQNRQKYCLAAFDKYIKDTVEDEFVDVMLRIISLAGYYKTDLTKNKEAIDAAIIPDNIAEAMLEICGILCTAWNCHKGGSETLRHKWLAHALFLTIKTAEAFDVNWEYFLLLKQDYNKHRPTKHGGKSY